VDQDPSAFMAQTDFGNTAAVILDILNPCSFVVDTYFGHFIVAIIVGRQ
jgi:hypothetical protein